MSFRLGPAAALSLVLTSGCAATSAPAASNTPGPIAGPTRIAAIRAPLPMIDPARRARIEATFPDIGRLFREAAEKNGLPNAEIGVVVGDRLAFAAGFGARTDAGGDVGADTVFRIGSITKVFTGMALLALRDDGRIGLDDPVTRYVPELGDAVYPTLDSPVITLRNLVTHTSGLPRVGTLKYSDAHGVTEQELGEAARRAVLDFAPGTDARYSNLAMALGGLVVARASGEPTRDFITRRILAPLGMRQTFWDQSDVPTDKLAAGHQRLQGKYQPAGPHWRLGAAEGMGGLYSSVADLARFASYQMTAWPARSERDPGPIRRSSLRESQLSAGLARPGKQAFGVSWVVISDSVLGYLVMHDGGTEGYSACLILGPTRGIGVILLASASDAVDGMARDAFTILAKAERDPDHAPDGAQKAGAIAAGTSPFPPLDLPAGMALGHVIALLARPDRSGITAGFSPGFLQLIRPEQALSIFEAAHEKHGACRVVSVIAASGPGAGEARFDCERGGSLKVELQAQPEGPYLLESLRITPIEPDPKPR
ncbi:MAG: serine hydrolase domain-containing protein [Byssovorax sp.]